MPARHAFDRRVDDIPVGDRKFQRDSPSVFLVLQGKQQATWAFLLVESRARQLAMVGSSHGKDADSYDAQQPL